jgi:cephalosporin-C deacetylase-like acetyl esterase
MFFPGSGDIYKTSYDELTLGRVEFILKSGRALIYPVYKGTYDRNSGLKTYVSDTSNQYRDFMIAQSKDLGRAIDYVESRADLDADRLAYIGISWGSKLGPIMVAMEKRLKTAVFFVGGLSSCLTGVTIRFSRSKARSCQCMKTSAHRKRIRN